MRATLLRTFRSLRIRNFRLFFVGQFVSSIGLWMQQVAEIWLIHELTGSAAAVGLITVTHFGPVLLFGLWGGVIADRLDKRRIMLVTQTLLGVIAGTLAVVSATGGVTPGALYGFSFVTGLVVALDNPTRRAFVREMVSGPDVANAVSLVSMLMTSARVVGPAASGLLLAASGASVVFAVNSISYGAVLVALLMMRVGELERADPVPRARGQLMEGLRYVWATPGVRVPIVMVAWIGTLSFNFSVLLVLFAEQVFDAGSGGFGLLISLSAVGSLIGAVATATRASVSLRFLAWSAIGFGVVIVATSQAPSLAVMALLLVPTGYFGVSFLSGAQGVTQERTDLQMQGRVMALFAVVFLGSTPVGGMLAGGASEAWGPRVAFAGGGVAAVLTGVWAWRYARRGTSQDAMDT